MRSWRPSKRRASLSQPSLPGLVGSTEPAEKTVVRRLATPGEHALHRAHVRLGFTLLMFGIAYLAIAIRLADLTLLNEGPEVQTVQSDPGEISIVSRADLTDRNGTVLATSLPTFSLCADAKKILDPDDAVNKIMGVLPDLNRERLSEDLHSAKRCAPIRRHLTPRQYYALNKLGIAGLEFHPDEGRIYPTGNMMAHVLGYTDIDNNGIAGLEKGLNKRLVEDPTPISLSIDIRLQTILHRELSNAMNEFKAVGATGLIMDATNGEILSMVSLPDFNPQRAGDVSDDAKFNRASLGVYEMGSTFKIFNTALALDSGLIKVSDRFDATHPIEIGGRSIRDFHPVKRWLNVAEIVTNSSNIGSARMAQKLGAIRQRAFFGRLGLLEKAPIELPETGQPLVPSTANWGDTVTMTASFGHGIAVSAVQLVSAVATILNNGQFIRPTLLKRDITAQTSADKPREQVISARTAALVRGILRLVVTDGTGQSADVQGYMVGGKTGTADKLNGRRYSENARLSSFVGAFPIQSPRYIVFALLDDPKGNAKTHGMATGGWTAAPIINHVISQVGPLLGIMPLESDIATATERQLLRPLGSEVLDSIRSNTGSDDYAAIEINSAD